MFVNFNLLSSFSSKNLIIRNFSTPSLKDPIANLYKKTMTVPPFSQSPAYFGRDRSYDPSLLIPSYIPSYYDSQREERDTDELWEADQRLILINSRKQATLEQIKTFKKIGKDTRELEMEMVELTAKEAEIRAAIQKEKQIKKDKQLKMLETRHKKEVKDENNKQQNTSEQKRWFW
ncbi:hypothetical protein Mgra_00007489 [Meloidogyne graminicola]|uniref:Uncharacterized protein n=1 Tax=Meloidogyne graminicola TaxID=189291 RepID=A0A8S9ZIJ7_9BILA|nr:hypothetical protein Mgra_00007489 [Meloidogyne graminicola]